MIKEDISDNVKKHKYRKKDGDKGRKKGPRREGEGRERSECRRH